MKIAIISDIHANIYALEKVLEDIDKRNVDIVCNLGDSIYGPIDPAGVADILIQRDFITVAGNEDTLFIDETVDTSSAQSYSFTKSQLAENHLEWLRSIPNTNSINDSIFMFHASPNDQHKYFLEEVKNGSYQIKDSAILEDELKHIPHSIILCGHGHIPHVIQLKDKLIINPGSVGIQAYDDVTPEYHKMESGSPHARYTILTIENGKTYIDQILLSYDWETAAKIAKQNGREDWIQWLLTGRV